MKKVFILISTTFCYVIGMCCAYSQSHFFDAQTLNSEQGLPHNGAFQIKQDHKGYIWIQQAEALKVLDETKSRFFSNITHEFRTPLTLVTGPAEKMLAENPPENMRRPLRGMLKNARSLLGLINQMLDISKLESAQMQVEISHGDIVSYTKSLVYQFEPLAATSHIPLILLTAKASLESRMEGFERGADAFMSRPFSPDELALRIRKLIEIRMILQARYQNGLSPDILQGFEKEDEFINEVRIYITENINESNLTGEVISRQFGMSRMQLHRKLKALIQYTPADYVRSIRLEIAMQLLQANKLSISEIAYQTGFSSPTHFGRTFKKVYGKTPSEVSKS